MEIGTRPLTFLNVHTTEVGALRRVMGRKGMFGGLCIAIVVICIIFMKSNAQAISSSKVQSEVLSYEARRPITKSYWRASSSPRYDWPSDWPSLPEESNGYLLVRCYGDLHQHRAAISDAVVVAQIMNATLVLPELDMNFRWHNDSGFQGLYNVERFNFTLRDYVRIVESMPETEKIKPYQLQPPRDAPISWYEKVALKKMKEHGAIYLTPFLHSLAEEIDNPDYQRLRCKVNYDALGFKEDIRKANLRRMYEKLAHRQGPLIAIDLRFGMDMVPVAGCLDIFTPREQRTVNFTEQKDERANGNCPLTPEQIGLILSALGFDNSTMIYLIGSGEHFNDERFMKPLRSMFPDVENRSMVDPQGLAGLALDYMMSLYSQVYIPIYDGSSHVVNTLLGHRIYFYGFTPMIRKKVRDRFIRADKFALRFSQISLRPDRKVLARILIDREKGEVTGFEEAVRRVMLNMTYSGPHESSFYMNPWPQCFCQTSSQNPGDQCPSIDAFLRTPLRIELKSWS